MSRAASAAMRASRGAAPAARYTHHTRTLLRAR